MDYYHIWVDLQDTRQDLAFNDAVHRYLGRLQREGRLASYRLTRRKLGFGPPELPEFHIEIAFTGLEQLDRAFARVAPRRDPIEGLHAAVYGRVSKFVSALYRTFPDAVRVRGEAPPRRRTP